VKGRLRFLVPASVLLIVTAFALAACGSSGNSDESQIEAAIETSATSKSPSKCTEVETQAFVEQSTGESGQAAVKQCEAEAPEESAESVEVSNIEIEGSEATAEATVTGSALDGQTLEVALVEEEGQWKLNELMGFVNFDQAKLVEAFATRLKESGELKAETASCIVEALKESSREEVEELILNGSSEKFEQLASGCSE
jgi:hypothetical protein